MTKILTSIEILRDNYFFQVRAICQLRPICIPKNKRHDSTFGDKQMKRVLDSLDQLDKYL